jgi:DHA1 family bicyclomycin/chloramphenicol resistance-like MFS transporter
MLNLLIWNPLLNMGVMMVIFTGAGVWAIIKIAAEMRHQQIDHPEIKKIDL